MTEPNPIHPNAIDAASAPKRPKLSNYPELLAPGKWAFIHKDGRPYEV